MNPFSFQLMDPWKMKVGYGHHYGMCELHSLFSLAEEENDSAALLSD